MTDEVTPQGSHRTVRTNELSLEVKAPRRMATFRRGISLQNHWRWIFSFLVVSVSIAFLVLTICLVPFPSDLLQANHSPSQLTPYDPLNMAITVTLMQVTVPPAVALILRYHTECQRDLTVLMAATWTGEMTLAAKHLLHFQGFDRYGVGVPAALAGLLWVGLKLEHLLINALVDLEQVLPLDFRLPLLRFVLRIEMFTVVLIVVIIGLDEILDSQFLRISGSFCCWMYLCLGIYFYFILRTGLNFLVAEVDRARARQDGLANPDVMAAIYKIRTYRRTLGLCSLTRLLILVHSMLFSGYLWPIPDDMVKRVHESLGNSFFTYVLTDSSLACNLWFVSLIVGITYIMGFSSLFATHQRHEEEQARIRKRGERQRTYLPAMDEGWQQKVEDLAKRALSLEALLNFYSCLGRDYMHHFDSHRHTTDDVVRQAIIPLSAPHQSDMSKILMQGRRKRPNAMVTHTWHSRFRDLVASVVAEALQDSNYARIAVLLDSDIDLVKGWLRRTGDLQSMYWICAFCVNQHSSICQLSFPLRDSVTGAEVKGCDGSCPKYLNMDPPCRTDLAHPTSINCEMNKFSDMISWLAATDESFRQVLAVDGDLELFSRAWCVAEVAEAYMMGMKQLLKIESTKALQNHRAKLKALRIEDMKASRVEDVQEILGRIPNKDEFNSQLQRLFGKLFSTFWHLHPSERLKTACRELRWQLASQEAEALPQV